MHVGLILLIVSLLLLPFLILIVNYIFQLIFYNVCHIQQYISDEALDRQLLKIFLLKHEKLINAVEYCSDNLKVSNTTSTMTTAATTILMNDFSNQTRPFPFMINRNHSGGSTTATIKHQTPIFKSYHLDEHGYTYRYGPNNDHHRLHIYDDYIHEGLGYMRGNFMIFLRVMLMMILVLVYMVAVFHLIDVDFIHILLSIGILTCLSFFHVGDTLKHYFNYLVVLYSNKHKRGDIIELSPSMWGIIVEITCLYVTIKCIDITEQKVKDGIVSLVHDSPQNSKIRSHTVYLLEKKYKQIPMNIIIGSPISILSSYLEIMTD